jgi:riboflavin synthase
VQVPADFARYVAPKGSITIDGISLTVARWQNNIADIAVIPYTYENTNIRLCKPGDAVNLEGDVIGKYVERYLQEGHFSARTDSQLTVARLIEEGF